MKVNRVLYLGEVAQESLAQLSAMHGSEVRWLDCHPEDAPSMVALPGAFATYNPYIVDTFEPEEIRIVSIGVPGVKSSHGFVFGPFTLHPDWETSAGALSPGEFWSCYSRSQWREVVKLAHSRCVSDAHLRRQREALRRILHTL